MPRKGEVPKRKPLPDPKYTDAPVELRRRLTKFMNVIMSEAGGLIEVQGTAEQAPFSRTELDGMLDLATAGIQVLVAQQKAALGS